LVNILKRRLKHSRESAVIDAKVRAALVATLYSSPGSLALGALCGLIGSIYIALQADDVVLDYAAILLTAVVAGRIASAYAFHRTVQENEAQTHLLELIYEAGAWGYALVLGVMAGLTVALAPQAELHVLAAANTIGYAAGVSARNAGRPKIAIGQNILASLPLAAGLMVAGSVGYWLLAISQILFVIAVIGITLRTYDIVHASFASAHRNAALAQEMRTFATTDPVTSLVNRAGLDNWLADAFQRPVPQDFALFWFDLDRFKEVNDTLGHPIGDKVLIEVASRMRAVCDPDMLISRFGGDEFVIVAPAMTRAAADAFGRLILTVVAQPFQINGHNIAISASLGIALYPEDGQSAAVIMQQADMALYASKVGGRSQQNFFDPSMDQKLNRRRELEAELRSAVRSGELQLHYQPIVDLRSGQIAALEALVRWNHPQRGMLSPDEFIAIAEATGLIITMGNWIVLEACRTAATWPGDAKVAVNVSPVQMQAPGAALGFLNALKVSGLPAHRLELEITENVFADKTEHVVEFVRLIREAGIGLTLDDFGTGYSSLSYIREFDFSKIKIDRSFISGLAEGDRASAIVSAVAGLAEKLDMPVVAEGIETAEDAARVRELGCTQGQGYLFSKGVPASALPALFDQLARGKRAA
jgi:diguanylate cyclase (GGDEF)-like protein